MIGGGFLSVGAEPALQRSGGGSKTKDREKKQWRTVSWYHVFQKELDVSTKKGKEKKSIG